MLVQNHCSILKVFDIVLKLTDIILAFGPKKDFKAYMYSVFLFFFVVHWHNRLAPGINEIFSTTSDSG